MWSSPLTQGIKIGLLGYGRLLRLSQDRMPIVFYDRPAIQAEAMTFFFFCLSAQHPQSDRVYPRSTIFCNRVDLCIWMFLVRYFVTGCIFRAPSAIWQGQVLTPPPSGTPLSSWEVECPPPPPGPRPPLQKIPFSAFFFSRICYSFQWHWPPPGHRYDYDKNIYMVMTINIILLETSSEYHYRHYSK